MSHGRTLEQLEQVLADVREVFAVDSILPSEEPHADWRHVSLHAIDEATEHPGIVYDTENHPAVLRFCPVHLLGALSVVHAQQAVSPEQTVLHHLDGTFWRHTASRGLYRVIQTAISDETGAVGVLYRPRENWKVLFFRPLWSFRGTVELNGVPRHRFEQIDFTEFDDLPAHG